MDGIYAILSVVSVSLISLLGLVTISLKTPFGRNTLIYLVSFSAGALLGDVFIHLLPELAANGNLTRGFSLVIFAAIVGFFILEKYLHWHHHHGEGKEEEHSTHPLVFTNLIGDAFHNIIDGMVIAGAYLLDTKLGLATTLAVMLHEIPQEIGDYGVLVYAGLKKSKALLYNLFSGGTAIIGALVVLYFGQNENFLGVLAALGIGSFIYISVADLIPQIHREHERPRGQLAFFVLGVAIMAVLLLFE